MNILFSEEEHRYWCPDFPELKFTSVSGVISALHEKFDAKKVAASYSKKTGISVEELLEKWQIENGQAIARGHKVHLQREEKTFKSKNNVHKYELDIKGYKKGFDLDNLKPGIYPELIVHSGEHGLIGTADYVEIFEDNTFILEDYKSNKKLEFQGFPVYNSNLHKKIPKKMLSPISHLDDCNGMHYTIQLSMYAYMLEQFGYKLRPNGLLIRHILFEGDEPVDEIPYPVNYLKKEVKDIFRNINQILKR